MKIDFIQNGKQVISYKLGKSIIKISEEKVKSSEKDNRIKNDFNLLDSIVRNHEQSHMDALGPYAAGIPNYSYITDSAGNNYAAGGSVKVDISTIPGDPEATLKKANSIMNAAFAPGIPSGADKNVADKAMTLAMSARKEINNKNNKLYDETANILNKKTINYLYNDIKKIDIYKDNFINKNSQDLNKHINLSI